MKRIEKIAIRFFLLLVGANFLISENGFPQVPLDLKDALRLARQNNLKLQQQQESRRIAILEERVQKANLLPTLNLSFSADYLSDINEIDLSQTIGMMDRRVELGGHDRSEVRLSVQQPIFTGFRLQSQVDLAKDARLNEQVKFDILSNEIYHRVYLIFYQFQSLSKQERTLGESLKRLDVQLENVLNLFNAAQVMAFDTLQVYNQALAVRIELQDVLLAKRLTTLQIARILDLERVRPIVEIELQPPSSNNELILDLAHLKSQALEKRPELNSLRLAKNGAKIQQKFYRSNYFPSVFAHANFHYAKPGLDPVNNNWMDY